MVSSDFEAFFAAGAGVAGALIGLLFVAISVNPDRLLQESEQEHRVRAAAALTAFTNALTVSLFSLVPGMHIGWAAIAVGTIGTLFVLGSLISLLREAGGRPDTRLDAGYLGGLVVVFVLQIYYGARLTGSGPAEGALRGVAILLIVCFLVGIARSWELIGGPSIGLWSELAALLRGRRHGPEDGEG